MDYDGLWNICFVVHEIQWGAGCASSFLEKPVFHSKFSGFSLPKNKSGSVRPWSRSIQALLSSPEPDDPLDTTVADHFKGNKAEAESVRLGICLAQLAFQQQFKS